MANFADNIATTLVDAKLTGAILVSSSLEARSFGNAEAVFRIGPLLLRFVRERGQAFLDVASSAAPSEFHQYDNVEIAMGWKTIDEVLAKREPEELRAVLARLGENLGALSDAFSGDQERLTRTRVERAARERGQVFTDRLRGK